MLHCLKAISVGAAYENAALAFVKLAAIAN